GDSVETVLGVAERRAALHRIEAGDTRESLYGIVGEDWDIDQRTMAALGSVGLGWLSLEHAVGELSGGEAMALALAARLLERPDILLLDEPTNNLDRAGRERVHEVVRGWRKGALIVASHDRELLELVDRIGEVRTGYVTWYGGGWTAYREAVEREQEAAQAAVRTARAAERREQRERREAEVKLAGRRRSARAAQANAKYPKIVARERRRDAQVSAGRLRRVHEERLARARDEAVSAEAAIREDAPIRIDLPATAVPAGRDMLDLREGCLPYGAGGGEPIDLLVRGPERIALTGPNGAGKTTALNVIVGKLEAVAGTVRLHVPARMLPQRLDVLDGAATVMTGVAGEAPGVAPGEIRSALARFGLRGRDPDRTVDTLSGGERLRATLAAIMIGVPAPQLLVLDEPTNSLDVGSVDQLIAAVECHRGALIVASHDLPFLRACRITRWLHLDRHGLRELDLPK
ncbi:MAG: ATP-binding cassette domain-containing protein, partial [Bifidobacteriaceae bacterium]|nr:ATP-binding cassette domain-containing protein [Bifidobacteriaceae bacterium]